MRSTDFNLPAVLVIDDDEAQRAPLAELIRSVGFPVVEAANGQEALDLLDAGLRALVVLADLDMPVMDGWTLLARLAADPRYANLRVAIISAESDLPPGYVLFRKPYDPAAVLDFIRQASANLASG